MASTGASKLEREITDANVDALRTRAEHMLWIAAATAGPAGRTSRSRRSATCAGRGCRRRASTICAGGRSTTGDWRDNGDGYVEKGPFPPPRRR